MDEAGLGPEEKQGDRLRTRKHANLNIPLNLLYVLIDISEIMAKIGMILFCWNMSLCSLGSQHAGGCN